MESARRFETLQIRCSFSDRETLFCHARKIFLQVLHVFLITETNFNGKMKSKLFHATTSPNGGRSSRREYFISTQPRIRYVATRNWGGKAWKKNCLSQETGWLPRIRSFSGNPLPFVTYDPFLSRSLSSPCPHERRNKKPRWTSFVNSFHSPIRHPFAHAWRPQWTGNNLKHG